MQTISSTRYAFAGEQDGTVVSLGGGGKGVPTSLSNVTAIYSTDGAALTRENGRGVG